MRKTLDRPNLDEKIAKGIATALRGAASSKPLAKDGISIAHLEKGEPVYNHRWVKGKTCEAGFSVSSAGKAFKLLLIEWNRAKEPYLVLFDSPKLRTLAEIHKTLTDGKTLVWEYVPKKQHGDNEVLSGEFAKKYPYCIVEIKLPGDHERDVQPFLEELTRLVNTIRLCGSLVAVDDDAKAVEGESSESLIKHRKREKKLRRKKLQEVLRATGKLACQVPGCGFDFQSIYEEKGEGFAHVHHIEPLKGGPRTTRLKDLLVVCANCHAMIHRGGKCLTSQGLIPPRASTSVRGHSLR